MREIRGNAKYLRALLAGAKFAIDYYQREYRWATKQVAELIEDLAEKFRDDYESADERSAVENYGHYFLGSIIISDRDGRKFIIDRQQRLTTLTLLLIHIYVQLEDDEQKAQIADLIFSMKFGRRSFNLDVDERAACMQGHAGEFGHPTDFAEYRNRIGGLLLLPKSFKASYGDSRYGEKRGHYLKQNLLPQSLHEKAYERDPGFAGFVRSSGLPFKPHAEFLRADLDARQELYRQLAEKVWSPERLAREAES